MTATATTFAPALKTLWPQKRYNSIVYSHNPFLALIPKHENFLGKNLVLALRYKDGQGRSSTFAKAQANKGATAGVDFTLTRAKDYWLGSIETEVLLASKGNEGALAQALDTESTAGMNAITRSLATALWGSGTGTIGRRLSISSSTVTLHTAEDITNFEVGMKLTVHATDGGDARDTGAVITVTVVNRDAGTFDFTGTVSGHTNDDYYVVEGDLNAKVKGVRAWVPDSAPAATTFFGVNRTADATRLGGLRIDISSMNPEEGLVHALYRLGREGGNAGHVFMNHGDFVNVQNSLGSKVIYDQLQCGDIGFQCIKVNGPKGPAKLLADFNVPKGRGFAMQMDTWGLYSLGKAPRILNVDGMELLREYNADANELRIAYYAQLGCEFPGFNANLALAT
jgi:hypothetical protein